MPLTRNSLPTLNYSLIPPLALNYILLFHYFFFWGTKILFHYFDKQLNVSTLDNKLYLSSACNKLITISQYETFSKNDKLITNGWASFAWFLE